MKRFLAIGMIWALLCVSTICCLAEGAAFDAPSKTYDQAILFFEEGDYRRALMLFEAIGDYQDSAQYALYTRALFSAREERWDDAREAVESLSTDFLDSAALRDYIDARELEDGGEISRALDVYRALSILDSMERAAALEVMITRIPKTPKITLTQGDPDGVYIRWETDSAADEYIVYRSMFSGYGFVEMDRTQETSYRDSSICADKAYHYKVSALRGAYESAPSEARQAKKLASIKMDCPDSIAIVSAGYSASLAWPSVSGATAYHVYRSTSEFGDYALVDITEDPHFVDPNAGPVCFYRISARADDGESKPSAPLSHSGAADENAAGIALSGVRAALTSPTTAYVSWKGAPTGRFIVEHSVKGQARGGFSIVNGFTHSIENLAPNTEYRVQVTDVLSGDVVETALSAPAAEAFKSSKYRVQRFHVYWVREGSGDFWQRSRTRASSVEREALLEDSPKGAHYILLEFSWGRTDEDKSWMELWVMRTPDGDVFTCTQEGACPGSWTGVYTAFPLEMFRESYGENITWEAGSYQFEVYFDGALAAQTEMTVR